MGLEFILADIKKRNGAVLYINSQLNPELILTDEHGTFIWNKITVLGIYVPNEDKVTFYKWLMKILFYWKLVFFGGLEWNGLSAG